MNALHSLVPIVLTRLIFEVRCIDQRYGIHKRGPQMASAAPGSVPYQYPYPYGPASNSYANYPNPYLPYMQYPFPLNPYRMAPSSPMYQSPYPSPYGYMPNMQQPGFSFPPYINPYSMPSYTTPNTTPGCMTPSPQQSYMTPGQQPSYTTQSQQPSYTTPTQQPSYMTPNTKPGYMTASQQPSYITPSQQSNFVIPSTQTGYMTPSTQPGYAAPTSQPAYTIPNPQPGVPQTPFPFAYPTNQTSSSPLQQIPPAPSLLSANVSTTGTFTDIASQEPTAPENIPQMSNSTYLPTAPFPTNQVPNNFAANSYPTANPSETAEADQTSPIINSNGETSSDLNSLPPQVKDFIDMIPNILSMPESSALSPEDQLLPHIGTQPRPSPFSLRKHSKLPLHKRKPYYPTAPGAYYPPAPGGYY